MQKNVLGGPLYWLNLGRLTDAQEWANDLNA